MYVVYHLPVLPKTGKNYLALWVVSTHGATPDPNKATSIASMPAPRNVREVRYLHADFFLCYNANYATIACAVEVSNWNGYDILMR